MDSLWCAFCQTLNALFRQKKKKRKKKTFVYSICFESVLIILSSKDLVNFIFDSLYLMFTIAAVWCISLKLNMIILKKD